MQAPGNRRSESALNHAAGRRLEQKVTGQHHYRVRFVMSGGKSGANGNGRRANTANRSDTLADKLADKLAD
jgi:hypothetical protein